MGSLPGGGSGQFHPRGHAGRRRHDLGCWYNGVQLDWLRLHAEEKQKSMETAQEYNRTAQDGRDPDIPIVEIKAGSEPLLFTQFFPNWDADFAEKNKFVDPYEAKLAAIRAAKAAANAAEEPPVPPVQPAAPGAPSLNPPD